MFLVTLINKHGHDVDKYLTATDRGETERTLRDLGWETDDFQDRLIWRHPETHNILRLEEVTVASTRDIYIKLHTHRQSA